MTVISSTKSPTSTAFKNSPDLHIKTSITNGPSYNMDKCYWCSWHAPSKFGLHDPLAIATVIWTDPVKETLQISHLCKAKRVRFLKIWQIWIYLHLSFLFCHCQFMSYDRELKISALTMYKNFVTDDRCGRQYMLLSSWYERKKYVSC